MRLLFPETKRFFSKASTFKQKDCLPTQEPSELSSPSTEKANKNEHDEYNFQSIKGSINSYSRFDINRIST